MIIHLKKKKKHFIKKKIEKKEKELIGFFFKEPNLFSFGLGG